MIPKTCIRGLAMYEIGGLGSKGYSVEDMKQVFYDALVTLSEIQ